MPTLAKTTKQWGKVDKSFLHQLIVDGEVDIEDLSFENIDDVHARLLPPPPAAQFSMQFQGFCVLV